MGERLALGSYLDAKMAVFPPVSDVATDWYIFSGTLLVSGPHHSMAGRVFLGPDFMPNLTTSTTFLFLFDRKAFGSRFSPLFAGG